MTKFSKCRYARKLFHTGRVHHEQWHKSASLNQWQRSARGIHHPDDDAGRHVLERQSASAIWHMHSLQAELANQLRAYDLGRGAYTGGRITVLAGFGLDLFDERRESLR